MNIKLKKIAPDCHMVVIGELLLYFSYETIVGFYDPDEGKSILSENIWSNTTGKHLNNFADKSCRIPHEEFTEKLEKVLGVFNWLKL